MSVTLELKIKFFDEFYNWLKSDGLKPIKSERLHKKVIFANLNNGDSKTEENFSDFLQSKENQFKIFENQIISFDGVNKFTVKEVEVELEDESFKLIFTNNTLTKCNFEQFEYLRSRIIEA